MPTEGNLPVQKLAALLLLQSATVPSFDTMPLSMQLYMLWQFCWPAFVSVTVDMLSYFSISLYAGIFIVSNVSKLKDRFNYWNLSRPVTWKALHMSPIRITVIGSHNKLLFVFF